MKMNFDETINFIIIADSDSKSGLGHIKRTTNFVFNIQNFFNYKRIMYFLDHDFKYDKILIENSEKYYFSEKENNIIFFIEKLKLNNQIIIIDSYKISQKTIKEIYENSEQSVIILFDDIEKFNFYYCDYIINYNPNGEKFKYFPLPKSSKKIGFSYFPPSPKLKKYKEKVLNKDKKKVNNDVILITFGGVDPDNFTEKVLKVVSKLSYKINVILGPDYSYKKRIKYNFSKFKNINFFENYLDITELLISADIIISSAGVTSFEIAYLGLPAIFIPISLDQKNNANIFREFFNYKVITNLERLSELIVNAIADTKWHKKIYTISQKFFHSSDIFKKLTEEIVKRLQMKKLRARTPIILNSLTTIVKQYNDSLNEKEEFKKVKWGNKKGMINRFLFTKNILKKISYKSILDIGTGTGMLFECLCIEKEKEFFACDLNFKMLKQYRDRFEKNKVKYFVSNIKEIPIKRNCFDVVTLIGVIQNCGESLDTIFKNLKYILTERGYLFFITKNLGWRKFLNSELNPELEHNWFFDFEIEIELIKNNFIIIEKGGFDNKTGKKCKIESSHEIYFLVQKNDN